MHAQAAPVSAGAKTRNGKLLRWVEEVAALTQRCEIGSQPREAQPSAQLPAVYAGLSACAVPTSQG